MADENSVNTNAAEAVSSDVEPPKPGVETSSFKVAIISALAPVALLLVIVLGLIFVEDPVVRPILIDALKYLVSAGIIGGAAVGWKYVDKRGDVSVAKVQAIGQLISAVRSRAQNK